jgi:hypothetical protein
MVLVREGDMAELVGHPPRLSKVRGLSHSKKLFGLSLFIITISDRWLIISMGVDHCTSYIFSTRTHSHKSNIIESNMFTFHLHVASSKMNRC